jgi:hypothetical protein
MRWYIARLRAAVQKRATESPDGEVVTLSEAQRRLTLAKAEREEMEIAQLRAELIPLSLYEARMAKLVTTTKARLLYLPARIAPNLVGLARAEIRASLEASMKDALRELAASERKPTK